MGVILESFPDCASKFRKIGVNIEENIRVCFETTTSEHIAGIDDMDAGGPILAVSNTSEGVRMIGISAFGNFFLKDSQFASVFARADTLSFWIHFHIAQFHGQIN